ncbi:MAG TPA: hypothetical protein VNM87_09450 [Candidatus Udaeobacter sp.]|nr:hypothetical protein [Candidatus Udaeobacter sp.]
MSDRSSDQRTTARWAAVAALLGLAALGLFSGCPRDPESPDEGGQGLVNLSDPDSVLFQIQVGVANGIITQYLNAFTQDFVFHPDLVDSITLSSQNPGVFDFWDLPVERQVMQLVLASYLNRSVTFANTESTVVNDREVNLREQYTLILDSERYQGEAEFKMIKESSNDWRIVLWNDRQLQADPDTTWGILKGLNR